MTQTLLKTKTGWREVAILDASRGSVELYTLPQSVRTAEDLADYLRLTLDINSSSEWIAAEKIVLSDFRTKKPRTAIKGCGNCGRVATRSAGGVNRCERCVNL